MNITSQIFQNLKESESVKKPYGDKPEEGKKLNISNKAKASVPKGKGNIEKYKARKLQNNNRQAADIYASDTDKVMDNISNTNHSDKGTIAKQNTTKATSTINKPFGDKIQQSTSKLIKEGANCEDCKECDTKLKESESQWKQYQDLVENTLIDAGNALSPEDFSDFLEGVIDLCQNFSNGSSQLECDKPVKECDTRKKKLKERYGGDEDYFKVFETDVKPDNTDNVKRVIDYAVFNPDGNGCGDAFVCEYKDGTYEIFKFDGGTFDDSYLADLFNETTFDSKQELEDEINRAFGSFINKYL